MPKKILKATPDHRLADWYEKSGLARFCETVEFRAKGTVEMSDVSNKRLHGTVPAATGILIVNSRGFGHYRRNLGYGWEEGRQNGTVTLVLPANCDWDVAFEHHTRSLSLDPAQLETQMHVRAERLAAAFERLSNHCFTKNFVNSLMKEMWHNSAEETGWLGELFCDSASLALVAYLLREELRSDQQAKRGGLAPHQMRMLIEFMSSRLSNKLRISELAGIAGLSEYHFIRAFQRETGITPYQYVLRMRVNKASELLRQQPYISIDEIALLCGFGSASALAQQFRRLMGMSPRAYRDRL